MKRQLKRLSYFVMSVLLAIGVAWGSAGLFAKWYGAYYRLDEAKLAEDYALGFYMLLVAFGAALVTVLFAGLFALFRCRDR